LGLTVRIGRRAPLLAGSLGAAVVTTDFPVGFVTAGARPLGTAPTLWPAASDCAWGVLDCEVWSGAGFGCGLDLSLKRKIWLMMIRAKVTANTINMRRSPPGSCCGFLYSTKFKFRSRGENSPANYPEIRTLVSRSLAARDRIPRARRDGSAAAAR